MKNTKDLKEQFLNAPFKNEENKEEEMSKFDFKDDLKLGQKCEEIIIEAMTELAMKADTFDYDAVDVEGNPVEIKSDFWMNKTGNICIERFSNNKTESPGGPWQSQSKNENTTYYIAEWGRKIPSRRYLVKVYVFTSEKLIEYCEANTPDKKVYCKNKGWNTENWLYKMTDLVEIAEAVIEMKADKPKQDLDW